MSEYGDPISPEQIEQAIERLLFLRRSAPERSLDEDVREAVAQTICACVLGIEDDVEHHLSGTHAGVLEKVRREAQLRLAAVRAQDNRVDEASKDSFPASDPPGWIWQRPAHPQQKETDMIERTSAAEWHGGVPDGGGSVSLGSGLFEGPYSFGSRFEEHPGTNPEELLGAAHASCFSMALSLLLTKAGHKPRQISTVAKVRMERIGEGFAINHIELLTEADVPGLEASAFSAQAEAAKKSCPVSKALAGVEISLTANLR
jgi:osmotically inducible protein OsmC